MTMLQATHLLVLLPLLALYDNASLVTAEVLIRTATQSENGY